MQYNAVKCDIIQYNIVSYQLLYVILCNSNTCTWLCCILSTLFH